MEVVEVGPGIVADCPGHVELALQYPEVAVRGLVVHEAQDSRRAEDEGVPRARVAAGCVGEERPLGVLGQRDVGGGSLARAATTAIPRAIARASHAASAKGSADRTAGVAAAAVGPRHFF